MNTTRPNPAGRHWRLPSLLLLATVIFALAAACGGNDDDPAPTATPGASATTPAGTTAASPTTPPASPTAVPVEGNITVFAASSLTDAFKEAGTAFSAANPKTAVTFSFAASSALATQINEGAPADVFASADSANMKLVTDKGAAGNPTIFALNSPVVVVPKGNTTVATFADLAKPGIKLVLAGPSVPIGRYAREVLTKASAANGGISVDFSDRVLANLKSEEANVRAVLTKVQLDEADAGVVYVTDIGAAANDVKKIDIPTPYNVIAQYPIAIVKESKEQDVAQAFTAFLLSKDGQAILQKYGFQAPQAAPSAASSLKISGLVSKPSTLSVADIKARAQVSVKAKDKEGVESDYTGTKLNALLDEAGMQSTAKDVVFTGADGYVQTIPLSEIRADPLAIVAISDDGTIRNVIPSREPKVWVRGLVGIELK